MESADASIAQAAQAIQQQRQKSVGKLTKMGRKQIAEKLCCGNPKLHFPSM